MTLVAIVTGAMAGADLGARLPQARLNLPHQLGLDQVTRLQQRRGVRKPRRAQRLPQRRAHRAPALIVRPAREQRHAVALRHQGQCALQSSARPGGIGYMVQGIVCNTLIIARLERGSGVVQVRAGVDQLGAQLAEALGRGAAQRGRSGSTGAMPPGRA